MLPKKRLRPRSGIERAPQRHWGRHEAWVRKHECCVQDAECSGPIQFAHVRQDHLAGIGQKPPSWSGISLCAHHHLNVQHVIGHEAFDKRYGINSVKLAAEFASKSVDFQMKETMRTLQEWERAS